MSYIVQKNHLRQNIKCYKTLKWLSHKCKNLYNSALYLIKTHFDLTGKYLTLKDLFNQIKSHITYTQLHSDNAQLTLRTLRQSYSSFFELLKLKKEQETGVKKIRNELKKQFNIILANMTDELKK